MTASKRTTAGKRTSQAGSLWSSLAWGIALAIATSTGLIQSGIASFAWSEGRPTVALSPDWAQIVGKHLERIGLQASNGSANDGSVTSPTAPSFELGGPPNSVVGNAPTSTADASTIKVASFNIQVFGSSKLAKPEVTNVLSHIIRLFDVVAIQEVRSVDDNVVPTFVNMINNNGAFRYSYVIGPRLGRTNSKEQYAVIYNTDRIEVDPSSVYTTPDPQDLLHREPLVARFRVRTVTPEQAFTFSLVDIHTDPDETKTELDALADVYLGVQQNGSGEDDIILLGDLNVDEYHLGNLGRIANITHAISGVTTNTRRNKMYDNIVFDQIRTAEYTRRSGVLDLMSSFSLTEAQALEVSDHCPVWAEFSVYESQSVPSVAGRPMTAPR